MKLPIKKEWFDKIKSGEKKVEFRDAHITFVCEETGETITKEVYDAMVVRKTSIPLSLQNLPMFTDDFQIRFDLKK